MPRKLISFAGLEPKGPKQRKDGLGFSFTTPYYSDAQKQQVLAEVKKEYDAWKNNPNATITDDYGNNVTYAEMSRYKGGVQRVRGMIMRREWDKARADLGPAWQKGANSEEQVRTRREAWCQLPITTCQADCNAKCDRKWAKKDTACNYLTQKGKISGFHAAAGRGAFAGFPDDMDLDA